MNLALFRLLALRTLAHHPLRIGLAVFSIALGVAVVVAIWVLNAGTLSALRETLDGISGRATLTLEGGAGGIDESLLAEVRALPGVLAAAPLIMERVESPEAGPGGLVLMGVDAAAEQLVRDQRSARADASLALALALRPDVVLLSPGLARRAGVAPGGTMTLRAPAGQWRVHVADLLELAGPARIYEDSLVVMPLPYAQLLFARDGRVDRIDIITAPGDIGPISEKLEQLVAGRARVSRPAARGHEAESVLFAMRAMLSIVSMMALLVGAFLVYSTVNVALVERRGEIALLRAIGASRGWLALCLLAEQGLLGCAGGGIGWVLGALGAARSRELLSTIISRSYFHVEIDPPVLAVVPLLLGVLAGGLAALAASLLPVRRELSVDPVVGLRNRAGGATDAGERATGAADRGRALRKMAAVSVLAAAVYVVLVHGRGVIPHASISAAVLSLSVLFLLAAPTLRMVVKTAAVPLGRILGLPARLARDHLLAAGERSTLTVLAIAVGAALAFEVQITLASTQVAVLDWIERSVAGDLMVSRVGLLEPSVSIPAMSAETEARLAALEGVRQVVPVRLSRLHFRDEQILLTACTLRASQGISFLEGDPERALEGMKAGAGVLVSESFRGTFGMGLGDWVELPAFAGVARFEILGVIVDYSWPKGLLLLDIDLYRRIFADSLVDEFVLEVGNGVDMDFLRQRIRAELADLYPDLFLITNLEFKKEVHDLLGNFFLISHAQSLVTLVVAFFGVLGTLLIEVLLRARQLSMLRAIGATRGQVILSVALEGALLGLSGAAIGLAFGAWIGYVAVEHASPEEQGWHIPVLIPLASAGWLLAACVATAVLASLLPARRAARWDASSLALLNSET